MKTPHNAGDRGSIDSWLVSAGRDGRPGSPPNVPPTPASNFILGERRAYSRDDGTPGWEALEEIVGGLESGSSVAFASGMAATAAIFDQLPAGAVVALPDDCYQGVVALAQAGQRRGRRTVHRVAVGDTVRWIELCAAADLIWLESPSNPLLIVGEVDIICAAPRKRGTLVGVDNTFATPLNQQPLAPGADIAVQYVTKAIGGHWASTEQRHDSGRPAQAPSEYHGDALSRPGEPPKPRRGAASVERFRHDHLVRRAWQQRDGRRCLPTLLRLSVGIETVEDLWADLDRAVRAAV